MSKTITLVNSVTEYTRLEDALAAAREQRDTAIRDYLSDGNTVYTTAKLTGLSRQAVMKIRDRQPA